jgi:hypothetical protein
VSTETWWAERLEKAKTIVEEYEAAISGLLDGSIMSYQLDTGQTRTLVTKHQMSPMYLALERATNRVAVIDARCNGASTHVVPDF